MDSSPLYTHSIGLGKSYILQMLYSRIFRTSNAAEVSVLVKLQKPDTIYFTFWDNVWLRPILYLE